MKIFLEIAFITDQSTELAGFPPLLNRIERGVVKETVDVPMRIAQPAEKVMMRRCTALVSSIFELAWKVAFGHGMKENTPFEL